MLKLKLITLFLFLAIFTSMKFEEKKVVENNYFALLNIWQRNVPVGSN